MGCQTSSVNGQTEAFAAGPVPVEVSLIKAPAKAEVGHLISHSRGPNTIWTRCDVCLEKQSLSFDDNETFCGLSSVTAMFCLNLCVCMMHVTEGLSVTDVVGRLFGPRWRDTLLECSCLLWLMSSCTGRTSSRIRKRITGHPETYLPTGLPCLLFEQRSTCGIQHESESKQRRRHVCQQKS